MTGNGGIVAPGGQTGAAGVVGSGGIVGLGGQTGAAGVVGTAGVGGCGDLVDDMEAHTGLICEGNGRVGHWFTYIDTFTSSSVTPMAGEVALPELLPVPRGISQYAMHVSGFFSSFAGIGCVVNNAIITERPGTFDATGYAGIRFYAKGSGGLRVTAQMPATQSTTNGGTCALTSCMPNSYVYGALPSTSTWTLISVPFSYFTGGVSTPFQRSLLWSIEFQPYAGGAFDLWIDDLTFYK